MIQDADVNFDKSEVHAKPCKLYLLNSENLGTEYEMEIALCDSTSDLRWIRMSNSGITCESR